MKFYTFEGQRNLCGNIIRIERKKRNMTQKALATHMHFFGLIDINTNSISNMELGYRIVTDYELVVLARIFDIPVETFFQESKKISSEELCNFQYATLYQKRVKKKSSNKD